jgi:hypothetical protein
MWITFIATAFAAAICLSMVNLAAQLNATALNKDRGVTNPPVVEHTLGSHKTS